MSDYRFEVTIKDATRAEAGLTHDKIEDLVHEIDAHIWGGQFGEGKKECGALVEIEKMQLVGVKEGREVDLGDIPLSPEMKMREIARQYGDPDNEDNLEASTALYCMQELITWMKAQGKLK
ncbi:hypothetical protein [Massilia sp. TN1-12]|uniref:hypothetical protein n=1 Tax=Massilia paldalensis TaxID=3377675 RepID=UPI00384BB54C